MTLREIMVGYPATKDINQHPYYQGPAGQWVWRFYHFRFTRSGRWFLGLTGLIVFILLLFWNLDTQTVSLALYAISLWLVSLIAFLPLSVRTTLRHAERVTTGETLQAEVTIENLGRFPLLDLRIQGWGLPLQVDAEPENGIRVGLLRPGEGRTLSFPLVCRERGAFVLGGCRVLSDFPFGLLQAYRVQKLPSRLIVHPTFRPLTHFTLPSGRRFQPGGIAMASQIGDSFEYLGNREWRDGDNPRDIDWRATARLTGAEGTPLVVREWREEYFLRVGVVLDTHVPPQAPSSKRMMLRELQERLPGGHSSGTRRAALESAISLCAAVSDSLARQDYIVDLFAAGPNLYHLMAGRSLAYREQILDILACVESSQDEPLSQVAPRLFEDLDRLTTVICIVLDWDEPRRQFVESLRQRGVGVKVLLISEADDARSEGADMQVIPPSRITAGEIDTM